MAVPLHRLHQCGHQRFQALAVDPVRRLPDNHQRVADRVVVDAPAGLSFRPAPGGARARKGIACLRWKPVTASNSSRVRVFSARVPTAHLRASAPTSSSRAVVLILLIPVLLEPIRWGSISDEATRYAKGAF